MSSSLDPPTTFPYKLYSLLESLSSSSNSTAITWLPHGRAFTIVNNDRFMAEIAPVYFSQTKIRSFVRQLNLWGFKRVLDGRDRGAWYHSSFVRGRPSLLKHISRVAVKKNVAASARRSMDEAALKEKLETVDFYCMPAVEEEEDADAQFPRELNVKSTLQASFGPYVEKEEANLNVGWEEVISYSDGAKGAGIAMSSDADNNINFFEAFSCMSPVYCKADTENNFKAGENSRSPTPKSSNINSQVLDRNDLVDGCLHQSLMNFYAPMNSTKKATPSNNEGLTKFYPLCTNTNMQTNPSSGFEMNPNTPRNMKHVIHAAQAAVNKNLDCKYLSPAPNAQGNMHHVIHAPQAGVNMNHNIWPPPANRRASWHPGHSGMQTFVQHPSMNCMEQLDEAALFGPALGNNNGLEFPRVFPNVEKVQSDCPIFGSTTNKFTDVGHSMHSRQVSYPGLGRRNDNLFLNEFCHPSSMMETGIDPRMVSCPEFSHSTPFHLSDVDLSTPIDLSTPMDQAQEQLMTNFARALNEDCENDLNQDQGQNLLQRSESASTATLPTLPEDDEFLRFIQSVLPPKEQTLEQVLESLPVLHCF